MKIVKLFSDTCHVCKEKDSFEHILKTLNCCRITDWKLCGIAGCVEKMQIFHTEEALYYCALKGFQSTHDEIKFDVHWRVVFNVSHSVLLQIPMQRDVYTLQRL